MVFPSHESKAPSLICSSREESVGMEGQLVGSIVCLGEESFKFKLWDPSCETIILCLNLCVDLNEFYLISNGSCSGMICSHYSCLCELLLGETG